ncbi:MAG: hypothetical protein ACI977_000125 [Candidatus Nanohaloarchaea archaeon]|jgi:hypothetical protein
MLDGLSNNRDDDLSQLETLLTPQNDNSGVVRPEIREKLYSIQDYRSDNCKVHDEEELKADVRRAIYDLGADPEEWKDEVYEDVIENAEKDCYGRVNGGDIAEALRERRDQM